MVKGPGAEAAEELLDEDGVPGAGHTDQHKPNFVKHLNKTRTFSAKQKWEWAFDKILTVSGNFLVMFIYSEKATKFERISQSYLTSLSKFGDFFSNLCSLLGIYEFHVISTIVYFFGMSKVLYKAQRIILFPNGILYFSNTFSVNVL